MMPDSDQLTLIKPVSALPRAKQRKPDPGIQGHFNGLSRPKAYLNANPQMHNVIGYNFFC
jgi:hypothetical protein